VSNRQALGGYQATTSDFTGCSSQPVVRSAGRKSDRGCADHVKGQAVAIIVGLRCAVNEESHTGFIEYDIWARLFQTV
jgi:hypothetical protein